MSSVTDSNSSPVRPNPPWHGRATPWFWLIFGGVIIVRFLVLGKFTTHVDDILPLVEAIRKNTDLHSPWEVVKLCRNYTYAPLQFIVSLPIAFALSNDWSELLFWGRAASLTIWVVGVALGFRVLETLLGPSQRNLAILGGFLMVFSLRGTAESSQAYNYATTLVLAVGMGWLLATDQGLALLRRSWWPIIGIGLLFALSVWTTYQAVFLSVGFFMALGLSALWKRDWSLLTKGVLMGLFLCLGLGLVYYSYRGDPRLGVQGAFAEFCKRHPEYVWRRVYDYGFGGIAMIVGQIGDT